MNEQQNAIVQIWIDMGVALGMDREVLEIVWDQSNELTLADLYEEKA